MKYTLEVKFWKGYGQLELPDQVLEADIRVPGPDSNHSRGVAMNTLDAHLRKTNVRYAQSTSQSLGVKTAAPS